MVNCAAYEFKKSYVCIIKYILIIINKKILFIWDNIKRECTLKTELLNEGIINNFKIFLF